MMIHPSDEGSQDPKDSFDLARMVKFPLLVDVPIVGDGPPVFHAFVDCRTIGVDHGLRGNVRLEKIPRMLPCRSRMRENLIRELLGAHFFPHEQGTPLLTPEVRFIELYQMIQGVVFHGQMGSEHRKPMANGHLRQVGHFHGLQDGDLDGPAPEDHPKLLVWEPHMGQPGVRQKRESDTASSASVSPIRNMDMIAFTHRAIHVLAKDNTPETGPDLGLRRNLVELVHIHDHTPFARICANSF